MTWLLAIAGFLLALFQPGGSVDHYFQGVAHGAAIVAATWLGIDLWMAFDEFLSRWKSMGGGWAVVLLALPPPQAAMSAVASDGLDDDSGKLRITLIGSETDCDRVRQAIATSDLNERVHVKSYRPNDPMIACGFITTGTPSGSAKLVLLCPA